MYILMLVIIIGAFLMGYWLGSGESFEEFFFTERLIEDEKVYYTVNINNGENCKKLYIYNEK